MHEVARSQRSVQASLDPKRMQNPLSVFISYASEDHSEASDLAFYLAFDGFAPWLDREKILPGEDWDLTLKQAIQRSDAAIVCLSKAAVTKRGYLQREIRKVLEVAEEMPEGEVFLIPVRFEDCPVPFSLRKPQWVNLFELGGYERLRETLTQRAKALGLSVRRRRRVNDLTGIYSAHGTNHDGSEYAGTVLISRLGDVYDVTWKVGDDRFKAQGSRDERRFRVTGDFDFTYSIKSDGSLFGEWDPDATEKLIPVPPNSRFINSQIGKFGKLRRR